MSQAHEPNEFNMFCKVFSQKCLYDVSMFWYILICCYSLLDSKNHWCRLLWTFSPCDFSEFQGDRATHRMGILVASGWNRSNVQFNLKSWIFADIQYKQIV